MTRSEIIVELKKFFKIQELVCNHTYSTFGDKSWQFLDVELLHTLLVLRRDLFKMPMTINNWDGSGNFTQRGLRCNICDLTKSKTLKNQIYLTAHANGAGVDFDVRGLSAEQSRKAIATKVELLPYPIRLESGVTWVHLDVYDIGNGNKINYFSA